jgi:hypothetical protein
VHTAGLEHGDGLALYTEKHATELAKEIEATPLWAWNQAFRGLMLLNYEAALQYDLEDVEKAIGVKTDSTSKAD